MSKLSGSENFALLSRRWREARNSWWVTPRNESRQAAGRCAAGGQTSRQWSRGQWLRDVVLL
jgi:hypothetical protein